MMTPNPTTHLTVTRPAVIRSGWHLVSCGRSARSCVTLGMIVSHGIIVDVRYCAARTG